MSLPFQLFTRSKEPSRIHIDGAEEGCSSLALNSPNMQPTILVMRVQRRFLMTLRFVA